MLSINTIYNSAKLKLILGGLLLTVVIFLGCWIIVSPQFAKIDTYMANEKNLKDAFVNAQVKLNSLQSENNQLLDFKKKFKAALTKMSQQTEIPMVLENISSMSDKNQLNLTLLRPQEQKAHVYYSTTPLQIEALGQFDNLVRFLDELAKSKYFIAFDNFTISLENDNSVSHENGIDNNLPLKIYVAAEIGTEIKEKTKS